MTDLTTLPAPDAVQALSAEALLASAKQKFIELAPDFAERVSLESEPVTKLLEVIVYCLLVSLAQINDVAKSNLLAFAAGPDLDHLAAFYDLIRAPGEHDERFRSRIQSRIAALAGGGTNEYYRERAMSADIDVVDVAVLTPGNGTVDLAIWISPGADATAVIENVSTALSADNTKILGVPLSIRIAIQKSINVSAKLYREPSAPLNIAQTAQQNLVAALGNRARLGRDIARSWIDATLHMEGVARVELDSPATDIRIAPDEYAAPGNISIQDAGVEW